MCEGCQQRYCVPHFIEHRHHLAKQMDQIVQDRNILKEDLTGNSRDHPLISHVNEWEQKSLKMICEVAKQARTDIQRWVQQARSNLNRSLDGLTEELKVRREEDNYTEKDLDRWIEQLQKLRQQLDQPSSIALQNDPEKPPLQMIKIKQNRELPSLIIVSQSL